MQIPVIANREQRSSICDWIRKGGRDAQFGIGDHIQPGYLIDGNVGRYHYRLEVRGNELLAVRGPHRNAGLTGGTTPPLFAKGLIDPVERTAHLTFDTAADLRKKRYAIVVQLDLQHLAMLLFTPKVVSGAGGLS